MCCIIGEKRTKFEVDEMLDIIIEFIGDIKNAKDAIDKKRDMEAQVSSNNVLS